METYFVPYNGEQVAAIDIKGRRVIVLSTDRDALEEGLSLLGADRFVEFEEEGEFERDKLFVSLAEQASCDIVVAAGEDTELSDVLNSLEKQLGWVN
jgi:hypothetical protein